MIKLTFLALAGLCCLLVAECNEDTFHEEWHKFMETHYCSAEASDDAKQKYLDCCEHFPEEMKQFIMEGTKTDSLEAAMHEFCVNDAVRKEMCDKAAEEGGKLGMTQEKMDELMECKNSAD